ncbi:phosphoglycerate dehydrogenase [Kineococcus sp. SYSU DK003]|uniref:phosphoglycerate dehydrogenase n=1 Tax=Kineococcus sp. SYSU DK003 TaxID=3383124 RepID=UPI003D7D0368
MLVTTPWLVPGHPAHELLTGAGVAVVHGDARQRAQSGRSLAAVVAEADPDVVVAGTDAFTADVLASAPRLRAVCRTGVGHDNVDVEAASARGILVCTTPGASARSVAEHTLGLVLACVRSLPQNAAAVRAGDWPQPAGRELHGSVLGLVGLGGIGRIVALLGQAFGMRVVAHDPHLDEDWAVEHGVTAVALEELLAVSDVVSLHVGLTPATRHLLDARALARMRPTAYLVNTARGGVVDEDALVAALRAGRLAGAALDTVAEEPLPARSPLRGVGNLVVTAHVGASTVQARERCALAAVRAALEVLAGSVPETAVNAEPAVPARS